MSSPRRTRFRCGGALLIAVVLGGCGPRSAHTTPIVAPNVPVEESMSWEARCEAGDAAACMQARDELLAGLQTPERTRRAAHYLDLGCDAGDSVQCYLAGVDRLPNGWLDTDAALAFTRLRAACGLGVLRACTSLLQASESGIVERVTASEVDALFAMGAPDARERPSGHVHRPPGCERMQGDAFYAPLVAALTELAPATTFGAPGVLGHSRFADHVQALMTCTLAGVYGDEALGPDPRLRWVRALAPLVGGGFDVYIEWFDVRDLPNALHASRVHVTPEAFRVVGEEAISLSFEDDYEVSRHDARLDIDADGIRDMLVVLGTLSPGVRTELLIVAPSRGGGLFAFDIPFDDQATLDGCFMPSNAAPMLAVMRTVRHSEHGFSESCVAVHALLEFERAHAVPIAFTLGPRLTHAQAIAVLPPGGVPVLRESAVGAARAEMRSIGDHHPEVRANALRNEEHLLGDSDRFPFAMCPDRPVFLLRGHEDGMNVAQTVYDITPSEAGHVGPSVGEGASSCEIFE